MPTTQLNGTKPDASAQSLQQSLKKAMEADNLSQGAFATQIGVSSSVISQWFRGTYPGKTEEVDRRVQSWLATREDRNALNNILPPDPPYVETPTSRRILNVYKYTHARGGMGLIYGGAGVCKSSSMVHYSDGRRNVFSVTATPAANAVGAFLGKVCESMGVESVSRRAPDREAAIVEKTKQIRRVLLIIDEAQYLPLETYYEITMLREESRLDGVMQLGVIMQGNEKIYSKAKTGFAQLYGRFGKRLRIRSATEGDVDAVLGGWEAQQGLPDGYLFKREIRSFLGSIASMDGGLRNINETLVAAFFVANSNREQLTVTHLKEAWDDQGGGK